MFVVCSEMASIRLYHLSVTVPEPVHKWIRPGRSTCEQVLALSTFIENGFQQNLKTGAVFMDLTAAYDTVWQAGLLVKLVRSLPTWVAHTVEFLLKNRMFRVHIGDRVSRWRIQNNGLPCTGICFSSNLI